ncbi:MAG: Nif3-like dinuclear metal center hexameric protein [Flavobacteriales bacterium]|nr:Nif3-like dinuclear metal center hexameric protein [Flavobacteriales bacterium]
MKIKEIIHQLEQLAPPQLQESYDNANLIVGTGNKKFKKALICLDSTEEVIDEAIALGCNLVIAHHPIVFSGLKKFNGSNYIERVIIKAIKNDIAIYAIHTNLDNVFKGVNHKIAEKLGLKKLQILSPKRHQLRKLVFYAPIKNTAEIRNAVFEAGAGEIGNYSACSFNLTGKGTFKANDKAKPFVGEKGEIHEEQEDRIEVVYPVFKESAIIENLIAKHPYEEVAYDIYDIENKWNQVGSGMIGELPEAMDSKLFLKAIKKRMSVEQIRYTEIIKDKVQRIAVCGGSGSFLLEDAIRQKADVFITADFKYHQFFDADKRIMIADIGHYESEQFTGELIQEYLQEKIPNFANYLTSKRTNPINYI